MTITPFHLAGTGWLASPKQPGHDLCLGALLKSELPVQRDTRGTLLPPYREAPLLQTGDNIAEEEPWRMAGPAASAVSAEKIAENAALHHLVFACMRGDSAAWQQLVVSQHRRVYGICYRFTGSPTDAEDLTQDVFLKLYRNLQGFDPEKGRLHHVADSVNPQPAGGSLSAYASGPGHGLPGRNSTGRW